MRIEWSDDSLNDLREIISYVGTTFGGKKAEEVLFVIRDAGKLLSVFPLMGKVFVKDPALGITYRTAPSKLYQIVYFIDGEVINIVSIWNNRRNDRRLKRRLRRACK